MHPPVIQIEITKKCNLKCRHCDIWKQKSQEDLSLEQWEENLSKLKSWLGEYRVDISGGEPFIKKETLGLIDFCIKNGIQPVVTTNATLLTEEIISRLAEIEELTLNVSLDGSQNFTHDYLRGVNGTHQKVMDVLLSLNRKKRKCKITLATILMGYNISQILSLIKLIVVDKIANGINFQALSYNFNSRFEPDWYKNNELWAKSYQKEYFSHLIDELINIKEKGVVIFNSREQLEFFKRYFLQPDKPTIQICRAADNNFIINSKGEVLLCWDLPPIGNIIKDAPEFIWNSPLAKERREQIRLCGRTCRILNCNFMEGL